jgi:hypothetical protein
MAYCLWHSDMQPRIAQGIQDVWIIVAYPWASSHQAGCRQKEIRYLAVLCNLMAAGARQVWTVVATAHRASAQEAVVVLTAGWGAGRELGGHRPEAGVSDWSLGHSLEAAE